MANTPLRSRCIAALLTVLVLSSTSIAPAAAATSPDPAAELVTYSTDAGLQPTMIVEYTDLSSLQTWANESAARRLVSVNEDRNQSVVAAPRYATQNLGLWQEIQAITAGGVDVFMTTPLASESFIEDVHPNYQLSIPQPVRNPLANSEFEAPREAFALNGPDHPTKGVAFDDVNTTTINQAQQTVGADNVTVDGSGVSVAVIDTGSNVYKGEVFGNGTQGSTIRISNQSKNLLTNETVASAGWSAIEDGSDSLHGTWTASAIAANTTNSSYDSLAPDATLLVLKALSDSGSGSTADIARAIRYAADQDVDVISMSLGSPLANPELREAIDYAYNHGVQAVVVAVGNSRMTRGANIAAPAHYGPTIAVAATTTNDSVADVRSAYFSQPGPDPGTTDDSALASAGARPDVGAPGFRVETMVVSPDGYVSTKSLSGTSMSTPLVASGIAAAIAENSTLASADNGTMHSAVTGSARPAPLIAVAETGHGIFAVDNLIDGTTPETGQREAMVSAAQQRQAFWEAHSDAQGGWLAGLLG